MRRLARGFSLLEILITIAIIGILAVILVSSMRRMIAGGQSTRCLANLHQMGGAAAQYAIEHRGDLPPAYWQSESGPIIFYRLLNEYLGPYDMYTETKNYPKIYRCPSDPAPFLDKMASYACNSSLSKANPPSSGNIYDPDLRASRTILFIDSNRANLRPGWGGSYESPMFRHAGHANAVMMDGSGVSSFREGSADLAESWGLK